LILQRKQSTFYAHLWKELAIIPSQIPSVGESEQLCQNMETPNLPLITTPVEHSRSYQMEMHEASMRGNIIVVVGVSMSQLDEPF
jgi:hypothetical protein